jgi:hypothetical protein
MYLPNSSSLSHFVFTPNDKRLCNTLNCDDSEFLLINILRSLYLEKHPFLLSTLLHASQVIFVSTFRVASKDQALTQPSANGSESTQTHHYFEYVDLVCVQGLVEDAIRICLTSIQKGRD